MTFNSYHEITTPLTTVRKQRFVEFFGKEIRTLSFENFDYQGDHDLNDTPDIIDAGFRIGGDAGTNQTIASFDCNSPYTVGTSFDEDSCVILWTVKLTPQTSDGTGAHTRQGGWGMCHKGSEHWVDAMKCNSDVTGNNQMRFYTADASEAYTDCVGQHHTVPFAEEFNNYREELTSTTATLSINGKLDVTRTANLPRYSLMPMAYTKYPNTLLWIRYCEAWNT